MKMKIISTLGFIMLMVSIGFSQAKIIINELKTEATFFIGLEKYRESFNYLQAAQKFSCDNEGSIIQNVNLQRLVMRLQVGQPGSDANSKTSFYLRFYSVDSLTGAPGKRILDQDVLVKNGGHGKISVDLRKYNIKVTGRDFFVAIEWILDDYNRRYCLLSRSPVDDESHIAHSLHIYQPFPGMVNTGSKISNVWVMTTEKKLRS